MPGLGLGLVAVLLAANVPMGVLCVIGLVSMVAALVAKFGPHYWIYMAFITPTVVCLNATSSAQVKGLSAQRSEFTLVGVLLVLVGTLLTLVLHALGADAGQRRDQGCVGPGRGAREDRLNRRTGWSDP